MRILYLSQLIPYPIDAGPKTRIYYVLRYLVEMGHEVTLLAFCRAGDTAESLEHLRGFCAAVHTVPMTRSRSRDAYHFGRSLLQGRPFLIARDDVAEMRARVRQCVESGAFDAIHADQLWMAPYALAAREAAGESRPALVLDQHNAVHLIPQRLADSGGGFMARRFLRREATLMRRYERETCFRFDHVVWVTAEDREAVGLPDPPLGPRSHIIPICVDPRESAAIERVAQPHRVTFLGGLHWPPNAAGIVWFAREVWPIVRAVSPAAVLTVIGKSPPTELNGGDERIEVTGYVGDPTPYLAETAVFVVPLHAGGGMRVKILDAWAWGLPIISTTIGAEGIAYRDGDDLIIADTAEDFARAVILVMTDPRMTDNLVDSGRMRVIQSYDWATVYSAWKTIYQI